MSRHPEDLMMDIFETQRQVVLEAREKEMEEKTFYVYLEGICGREYMGYGDFRHCMEIKKKKLADWKPGYLWDVVISDRQLKEYNCWD